MSVASRGTTPMRVEQSVVDWPAQCCVPAFVHWALRKHGLDEAPELIARALGVMVSPVDDNPWNLSVSYNPRELGVTPSRATQTIPALLGSIGSGLAFRHLRFRDIPFDMAYDALCESVSRNLAVGVGYDYNLLMGLPGEQRHLSPIRLADDEIELVDLGEHETRHGWRVLEQAAEAVDDGLWLIGEPSELRLRTAF